MRTISQEEGGTRAMYRPPKEHSSNKRFGTLVRNKGTLVLAALTNGRSERIR